MIYPDTSVVAGRPYRTGVDPLRLGRGMYRTSESPKGDGNGLVRNVTLIAAGRGHGRNGGEVRLQIVELGSEQLASNH